MATTYGLGEQVKITVNDKPYVGIIITYDENKDPVEYQVSPVGLGDVITATDDDLESL